MISPIVSIDVDENISAAAKMMMEEDVTALPVSDEENIVGILSRTDIIKAAI